MCKHVAAVLYGVGARLDRQPEVLFQLRSVDRNDLIAHVDTALPLSKTGPDTDKVLVDDDMAALFGLDMATEEAAPVPVAPKTRQKAKKALPPWPIADAPDAPAKAKKAVMPPKSAATAKPGVKKPTKKTLPPWPIAD